jgi:hypothetical protein
MRSACVPERFWVRFPGKLFFCFGKYARLLLFDMISYSYVLFLLKELTWELAQAYNIGTLRALHFATNGDSDAEFLRSLGKRPRRQ